MEKRGHGLSLLGDSLKLDKAVIINKTTLCEKMWQEFEFNSSLISKFI